MILKPTGLAVVAGAAAVAAYGLPRSVETIGALTGPDFPAALVALAQLAATALATWLLVVIVAHWARVPMPGVPAVLKSALFTTVAVAAVGAVPASAATVDDLDGLRLPDRPVAQSSTSQSSTSQSSTSQHTAISITVRPNDSLWSLASKYLPSDARDDAISGAVRDWYAANRAVIGSDPNYLYPGQQLLLPESARKDTQ